MMLDRDSTGLLVTKDNVTANEENSGILRTVFEDGKLLIDENIYDIRKRVNMQTNTIL